MRFSLHPAPSRRLGVGLFALLALAHPLAARPPASPALPTVPRQTITPLTNQPTPGLPQLLFGLGVGFERFGGAQGMTLTRVLPDSPAARAGLAVGGVLVEINGIVTAGRTADECIRIIQNTDGPVRLKYLGPDQQEKALKLHKVWLPMPPALLPYNPER